MTELHADGYFAIVPEWVLFADLSPNALKLYGILSLHCDYTTRVCRLGRKELAGMLGGVSLDTVDRAKAELVQLRALEVRKKAKANGGQDRNEYLVRRNHPDLAIAPRPPAARSAATPAATPAAAGAAPKNQTQEEPEDHAAAAPEPLFVAGEEFRPREVDGKPVSAGEASRSLALLASFNKLAGTRFKSAEYLRAIILRVRRYPEVSDAEHEEVVRHVLGLTGKAKWWDDAAPNIVWGNDRVFERSLHASKLKKVAPQSEFAQYGGETDIDSWARENLTPEQYEEWKAESGDE